MINNDTIYNQFRRKNAANNKADETVNVRFIFEGNSATNIIVNGEKIKAAIVLSQDKDMAYVYTEKRKPLALGYCFENKGLHYLIIKKEVIIRDVLYNKYQALLANVELEENVWGYFKSPETSYINTKVEGSAVEVSLQHPILVASAGLFEIGDKFLVKNRPWEVIETDTISSDAITYYSLRATTVAKESAVSEGSAAAEMPEEAQIDESIQVAPLQTIQLTTEDGVFYATTQELVNVKKKLTSVNFTVPFGIEEFSVVVLQNGNEKTINYKVV